MRLVRASACASRRWKSLGVMMAGEKKRRQRKLVTATNLACCGHTKMCEGPSWCRTPPGTMAIDAEGMRGLATSTRANPVFMWDLKMGAGGTSPCQGSAPWCWGAAWGALLPGDLPKGPAP